MKTKKQEQLITLVLNNFLPDAEFISRVNERNLQNYYLRFDSETTNLTKYIKTTLEIVPEAVQLVEAIKRWFNEND